MSRTAWVYVLGVTALGGLLSLWAFSTSLFAREDVGTLAVLALFATVSQLSKSVFKSQSKSETAGGLSFSPLLIFLAAGVFLLSRSSFILLVLIPHLVEWVRERLRKSASLRAWYIQPFNVATHIGAGLAARETYYFLAAHLPTNGLPSSPVAALLALVLYLILNHLMIGLALVLARGATWHETEMLDWNTLIPDLMMLSMGYSMALLWAQNPWFSLFSLAPLWLIRRALAVPQLQKEARVDAKTGLWNAAHFSRLFASELERASRFDHPLSVIMADLDLLRNINNTYGHLAGDVVLEKVGETIHQVIRDYDIAGRFGGEEFAIALPETDHLTAKTIAERIRDAIAKTPIAVSTSPTPIYVTISCGVASFPADGTTTKELIHQADIAVYQAKLQGRNRIVSITDVPHALKLIDRSSATDASAVLVSPDSVVLQPSQATAGQPTREPSRAHRIRQRQPIPHRSEWIAPYGAAYLSRENAKLHI